MSKIPSRWEHFIMQGNRERRKAEPPRASQEFVRRIIEFILRIVERVNMQIELDQVFTFAGHTVA
jgi:hypothetical protein